MIKEKIQELWSQRQLLLIRLGLFIWIQRKWLLAGLGLMVLFGLIIERVYVWTLFLLLAICFYRFCNLLKNDQSKIEEALKQALVKKWIVLWFGIWFICLIT